MEGQAPTTPTPQAGDPTGNPATPETETPQAGAPANDADKTARELKEARDEAAKYRRQLRDLETKVKDAETAKLSDQERAKKELDDLRAYRATSTERVKSLVTQMAVEREARKLGIVDEDAAYRLLDVAAIEYDGDMPVAESVKKSLEALIEARPYLKAAPPAPPPVPPVTPTNPGKPAPKSNLTREQIAAMSEAEINSRWAEVSAVLQSQGR